MVWAAALVLLAAAPPDVPLDPVEKARQSLEQASEEAAKSYWSDKAAESLSQGIDELTMRRLTKLLFARYSFGVCLGFVPRADYAAWDEKLAEVAGPPLTDEHRAIISHHILKMSLNAASSSLVRDMTSEARQAYCATELPAVRQFMHDI